MALNRAKVATDITVGADMSYIVVIQFFDSVDPATILWEETMTLSAGSTVAQLQSQVVARGQVIRQGLANQAAARTQVPAGTTVTVP
jgi:hypothetical protein